CAHLGCRLLVDPRHDVYCGGGSHELGDDVGIQNYHGPTVAARGVAVRGGSARSTPPRAPNRASSVRAKPAVLVGSLTASVRMARISASIERPCWAARTRSRSRT